MLKAQKQQDVVANIAISSQIPLTHQVNTYVLVVALVGNGYVRASFPYGNSLWVKQIRIQFLRGSCKTKLEKEMQIIVVFVLLRTEKVCLLLPYIFFNV